MTVDIRVADVRLREATANLAGKAATALAADDTAVALQRLKEASQEWESALKDYRDAVWIAARDDMALGRAAVDVLIEDLRRR